jgi:NAD-dependent dihydropyrimidine dehydrogenase PreA subunit
MPGKKITVVISQSQGKNPVRRHLEEELAAALIMQPDVDISLVPHLYDLSTDHTGMLFLKSVPGDLIMLSWLYPRGAFWTLDRQGVRGHEGLTLLKSEDEEDSDEHEEGDEAAAEGEQRGIGRPDVPNRKIYCIDLRASTDVSAFVDEIRRIAADKAVQTVDLMSWIGGKPNGQQLERYLHPEKMIAAAKVNGRADDESPNGNGHPDLPEAVRRRWYPVIDYSRCTNCMECIDFCLFGVYGVDVHDTILVEQQDNCKKGCPACSRVCPENAIIFPGHKTPAIAGADGEVAGLKIDLSKLFGAPDGLVAAVAERDAELVADGREAVGMTVGIPKRQAHKSEKRDELDDLMDTLDKLDL